MEVISSSGSATSEIIQTLNVKVANESHIFLLIYMEGCGPCNATRPEWDKIKNVLSKSKKIVLVDAESSILAENDFKKIIGVSPEGFPSMYYIRGKLVEKYEDSAITEKDRSAGSFVEWIKSKTAQSGGGRRKRSRKTKKKKKNTRRKSKRRRMH